MIIRVKKNTNYTIVSNSVLTTKELSLKAKGLYAYMISLPDDWDFSMAGLEVCLKEGRDAIRSTLKELCEFGIAVHDKKRAEDGTFTSEITIFQELQPIQESRGGFSAADTPRILSNNRLSTKNKNPTLFCNEEEFKDKPITRREFLEIKKSEKNDLFEEFWDAYPKIGKVNASKKMACGRYLAALKTTNHDIILNGVNRYKTYLETVDRPPPAAHPATWLYQERWASDYELPVIQAEETPAERGIRLRAEFALKKQQQSA